MLDVETGESAGAATSLVAEVRCCERRVVVYRAWLAGALLALSAAMVLFLLAMVKADQDTERRVTWEWIPFLLALCAYVPLFGVRPAALFTAPDDQWREETELCVRAVGVLMPITVAACLDFVLLPRQRFGTKTHESANAAVGALMLVQLFTQVASVFLMWLYTLGHRRHAARHNN